MSKRYTITAALPYANGPLHLGHLAGAYLPADIYARYRRSQGDEVLFVCGSDEHGAAITMRAKKEERSPQDIIDTYHPLNKKSFEGLGISFDIYHRTSTDLHQQTAQDFFKRLLEKGEDLEVEESEQYYDEAFDQFLADRYIVGQCPKCGHPEAYGDQCENCGSALSPTELIQPKSTLSEKTPVLKKTKHWYFRLDQHEAWLREWIENGKINGQAQHDPQRWKKHVVGQCLSWLDGGLQPRAVTRDLDWGVPVPVEGAEGKVLYVWMDAPIGYISATKQWAEDNGEDWEKYWKDEDTELLHFIGKDNIVFHCIVFPAMLKAHGDFILPKNVPANQFLNLEGKKFSKSRGWVIEQHRYLEQMRDFPNKEDALRYALIKTMPETRDGDFKWEDFVDFHDNELADNLGNFINRLFAFLHKYYEAVAPEFQADWKIKGSTVDSETTYTKINQETLVPLLDKLSQQIEEMDFRQALRTVMEISSLGNAFFQSNAPWKIYKKEPGSEAIKAVLSFGLQLGTVLSVALQPFLPFTAQRLRKMLNLPELQAGDWQKMQEAVAAGQPLTPAGNKVGEREQLFPKISKDDKLQALIDQQKNQLQKMLEANKKTEYQPLNETMQFEDFTKIDLRTGVITAAEKVKKTKKLLQLQIDLGFEQRQIVSGIAQFYQPEDIIGQQVVVVANLAPKKLRGIESQGMILMAENDKGELVFVQASEANFGGGFVVR